MLGGTCLADAVAIQRTGEVGEVDDRTQLAGQLRDRTFLCRTGLGKSGSICLISSSVSHIRVSPPRTGASTCSSPGSGTSTPTSP